jgi:hypothetical protein
VSADVGFSSISFEKRGSFLGGRVRYRTATAVSVLVIAVMFGLPAAVEEFLLPRLSDPVPFYEQILLNVAVFCLSWRLILVLPMLGALFIIATFTRESRVRN